MAMPDTDKRSAVGNFCGYTAVLCAEPFCFFYQMEDSSNIMSYISTFKLFQYITRGEQPDAERLLLAVDQSKILTALAKSKGGTPESIAFTNAPLEEASYSKLPSQDKLKIDAIQNNLKKGATDQTDNLEEYKRRYPDVPLIYNHLVFSLQNCERKDAQTELLHEIVEKFPNYLFGKTNLAEYYLTCRLHTEVPKIFDHRLELKQLYPDRTMFHISEVRAFYSVIGCYYARSGKMARAIYCWNFLHNIAPDHAVTLRLGNEIIHKELQSVQREILRGR